MDRSISCVIPKQSSVWNFPTGMINNTVSFGLCAFILVHFICVILDRLLTSWSVIALPTHCDSSLWSTTLLVGSIVMTTHCARICASVNMLLLEAASRFTDYKGLKCSLFQKCDSSDSQNFKVCLPVSSYCLSL